MSICNFRFHPEEFEIFPDTLFESRGLDPQTELVSLILTTDVRSVLVDPAEKVICQMGTALADSLAKAGDIRGHTTSPALGTFDR